jgi:hypothetical protein
MFKFVFVIFDAVIFNWLQKKFEAGRQKLEDRSEKNFLQLRTSAVGIAMRELRT